MKQPTTLDLLKAGRAKIEKIENWTTEVASRDIYGMNVGISHPSASCFCSMGAVWRAELESTGDYGQFSEPAFSALCLAAAALYPTRFRYSISLFNDQPGTTHADVLKVFDHAIAQLENQA